MVADRADMVLLYTVQYTQPTLPNAIARNLCPQREPLAERLESATLYEIP